MDITGRKLFVFGNAPTALYKAMEMRDSKELNLDAIVGVPVGFVGAAESKDELEKTMLEKAGLWLDEGYIFGTGGEGFERFNLAIPRSVLEDACQRLLKAFGK